MNWEEETRVDWRGMDWRTIHDELVSPDTFDPAVFARRALPEVDIFRLYRVKVARFNDPVSGDPREVRSAWYNATPYYAIDGQLLLTPTTKQLEQFWTLLDGEVIRTRHGRHFATKPISEEVQEATRCYLWVVPIAA
jgi:hypothetical protein